MALPFFYSEDSGTGAQQIMLSEETSKHIVQVLRMKIGEQVNITNGKGYLFTTEIVDDNKKKVAVRILDTVYTEPSPAISIAISLVKNAARFEWFLEKATETGIKTIIPLICKRTEKQHFRSDRMRAIITSAMLQSQQTWLPTLGDPVKFEKFISSTDAKEKFIAHCEEDSKQSLLSFLPSQDPLILIGPEGDFTHEEILLAIQHQYKPVTLGNTRLRTETAGIVAAVLLANVTTR